MQAPVCASVVLFFGRRKFLFSASQNFFDALFSVSFAHLPDYFHFAFFCSIMPQNRIALVDCVAHKSELFRCKRHRIVKSVGFFA